METTERWYQQGQAAWPTLRCTNSQFLQLLQGWQQRTGKAFSEANHRDIFLVGAVLQNSPGALQAFETDYLAPTSGALRRIGLHDAAASEVLQIVRTKLLVGNEHAPRLAAMVGDGQLTHLLRVVVTRTGLNYLRDTKAASTEAFEDNAIFAKLTGANHLAPVPPDAELFAAEAERLLRDLVKQAVGQLDEQARTLLRLHWFHDMTIDAIGQLYGVHRATAARWIAAACEQVERNVRRGLKTELDTRSDHLASLLNALGERVASTLFGLKDALQNDS